MAKFIGSELKNGNWGEDYFVEKLMEYLNDSYVIYRNRPVFGAQFDVALFAPNVGIIIFEVKAWKPETIKSVKNGDSIIIKTLDQETGEEGESAENPTTQVRGYVYKMRSKIRQKTGKVPLVYGMVCFPNLTKADYDTKGIAPVCEPEETLVREDLETKAALFAKLNKSVQNHRNAAKYRSDFTPELMFRVRQIFETDLKIEDPNIEDTDLVEESTPPNKPDYSILSFIPHDQSAQKRIADLSQKYALGTKLCLFVSDMQELIQIKTSINSVIKSKGLSVNGLDLKIDFLETDKEADLNADNSYSVFNCSAYLLPNCDVTWKFFTVLNGVIDTPDIMKVLTHADRTTNFNIEQYKVEHCDIRKKVIVRAGAGTGKTFTMISRIAFICHMQNCSMKEMANRIVMITFTDDAANQMENKIRNHFNNYYLLTGDTDCLAFINLIEGMQISTIHSYAKKIISLLGLEFGYGTELTVTSGDYKLKQIIAENVNKYIVEMQRKRGLNYVRSLGMPIYQIKKNILNMLTKLRNQSVDVASLTEKCFGKSVSDGGEELHLLISTVVPIIEKEADSFYRSENRLYLGNMMSLLDKCIHNKENMQRLRHMQTGRPQFMFVDEFQDTDNVQIEALTKLAEMLQYRLFVVGDVKQCIYRFRGAQENAFEQLHYKANPDWSIYSLVKNYRTDTDLLNAFHNTFSNMGHIYPGGEQLLIYGGNDRSESGRLIGTKSYNKNVSLSSYYQEVTISQEEERIPALFLEIERQKELILEREKQSGKRLKDKTREIAILVRENWQAEVIKKEGKRKGIEIITNTGGDLYRSEPALDMLTLVNALLHYDESDYLYAFVSSNFIGGSMYKRQMYKIRDNKKSGWKKLKEQNISQAEELQNYINNHLQTLSSDIDGWKDWGTIIKALRTMPVLQVLRKLYKIFKPWMHYGQNSSEKQYNYKLNVELLFEELMHSVNTKSVSINSLADVLMANIVSQKNVDSREIETNATEDIVIRCVTVHKAKGLEYGVVVLPFCSFPIDIMKRTNMNVSVYSDKEIKVGYQIKADIDNTKVTYQNDFFDENLEKNERMREEARILYVAMTRAIWSFSWIRLDNKHGNCWQNLLWEGN